MQRLAWPMLIALLGCGASFSDETAPPDPDVGGGGTTSTQGGTAGMGAVGVGGAAGGAGGAGGEGGDGGAGGAGGCKIPISDDFSSNWSNWGPVETGAGVLGISWSGSVGQYGGVNSAARHDLRDCSAFIEIQAPPTAGAQAFMYVGLDNDNRVGFYVANGTLRFAIRVGGANDTQSSSFDATDHRFWRIRESAGSVFWETSPDALAWTLQREAATPAVGLDDGLFNIGAGTLSDTTAGGAAFDNFNVVP
jgi:hypothetical protein